MTIRPSVLALARASEPAEIWLLRLPTAQTRTVLHEGQDGTCQTTIGQRRTQSRRIRDEASATSTDVLDQYEVMATYCPQDLCSKKLSLLEDSSSSAVGAWAHQIRDFIRSSFLGSVHRASLGCFV
jgi:hypothetical protein